MMTRKTYKRVFRCALFILLLLVIIPAAVHAQDTDGTIMVISVDGEITPAMAYFLQDNIERANEEGADGIIIEIQTLGGRVDSAIKMRDAMNASDVPIVVYIGSRAISAGALISISADTIVMAPGSHMGAAKPQPDDPKTVAFVSGEFRTAAERTGRDPQVAVAMVDESIEIEGLVAEGEILDLTANEAMEWGYADYIADGRTEMLQLLDWENATLTEVEMDFRHRIAQFFTSYEVASILLTLGMIALVAEFFTQGFGVSGFIGISCFALYFISGFMAGYTETWSAVLFFVGVAMLIVEIFVPELGPFGLSGLVAMIIGIIFSAPTIKQGILTLMIALLVTILSIPVFFKLFGKSQLIQRLVLSHAETVDMGYVHTGGKKPDLVGETGVSVTVLRPSGTIEIGDQRIDAIAQGSFIASGTPVRVIRTEGSKVIVAPVKEAKNETPGK
jgi:membrane-bound serine protease (ClpP class)